MIRKDEVGSFKVQSDRRRGERIKLKHKKFVVEKNIMKVVKNWNMFLREAEGCLFLEVFRTLIGIVLIENLNIIVPALSRGVD